MDRKALRRERDLRRRRDEILAAAGALFAEQGYETTTVQMIAERAGFSVGYLYKHFPGKRELLDALAAGFLDAYEQIVTQVEEEPGVGPLEQIRLELELLCAHLEEHRELTAVLAQQEPVVQSLISERLRRYRMRDERRLRLAHDRGEIPELDYGLLAALIDGVVVKLLVTLAGRDQRPAFAPVPDLVDEFILNPLQRRREAEPGKEESRT